MGKKIKNLICLGTTAILLGSMTACGSSGNSSPESASVSASVPETTAVPANTSGSGTAQSDNAGSGKVMIALAAI